MYEFASSISGMLRMVILGAGRALKLLQTTSCTQESTTVNAI